MLTSKTLRIYKRAIRGLKRTEVGKQPGSDDQSLNRPINRIGAQMEAHDLVKYVRHAVGADTPGKLIPNNFGGTRGRSDGLMFAGDVYKLLEMPPDISGIATRAANTDGRAECMGERERPMCFRQKRNGDVSASGRTLTL